MDIYFGGNLNKIAVTGTSCGAHLAALLVTDTKSHEKYGIDISKVKCWFLMSGFYDMELKENRISPMIKNYIKWICTPSKEAASPVALATGNEPPCLIIHGADDWCVPRTNAISLYNQLKKGKNHPGHSKRLYACECFSFLPSTPVMNLPD